MDLSIIIPVFNSENILDTLIINLKKNIKSNKIKKFEVILVNDASSDQSWEKIVQLKKKFKFIKGIDMALNVGQHKAIFAGLKLSSGKKIITMDDDMQHSPFYLMAICKKLDNYDCCYTIYLKRKHALWKRAISYLNSVFSNYIFNKPSSVYLSSYRGFKSEINDKMILEKKSILFLDALILKFSKKLCVINVRHRDRHEGESNYKILNLFSLWFDMIENFHFYPIRLGSLVGLIFFSFVKIIRINSKRNNKHKIKQILK